MKEKKNGGFLRWPWNVVIYVLLALVLRIFSIPIILFLMWLQRKNNPHGVAEGYCLSRTRKQLIGLIWALLMLLISVCVGVFFWMELKEDRSYWETMDYVKLAVAGGGAVLLAAGGIYMGYTALRDALFPARSALARSIRSQLPYPDEAPEVAELFAMVDDDLRENGRWFGPVGIGNTWVLGNAASRIDRIRGIFTVDKIRTHHTQTGSRTSRTLELVLIDNRWQKAVTSFNDPGDLQAAADCLALRVPGALRGRNDQYIDFLNMDESRQEEFERDFQQRQNRQASAQAQQEAMGGAQDIILKQPGGEVTSRVTEALVEETLQRCLREGSGSLTLTCTRPFQEGQRRYQSLNAATEGGAVSVTVVEAPAEGGGPEAGLSQTMEPRRALDILRNWLRKIPPDTTGWERRQMWTSGGKTGRPQPKPESKARLALLYASGAAESHTNFTREDVEAAAEGIVDGTYQRVDLTLPQGYLLIRVTVGDRSDGRCTVEATRPDGAELGFYSAQMSARQAAAWLTGYPNGEYLPGGPEWKNITKQVSKKR